MAEELNNLRKLYSEGGQDQVFKFLDKHKITWSDEEYFTSFVNQLKEIDVKRLNAIHEESMRAANATSIVNKLDPLETVANVETSSTADVEKWNNKAFEAIKMGKIGIILLAGGQGTRLGFDKPKGMYNIGLPSNKSLFQLMAERIITLSKLAKSAETLPWYIMTSPQTHKDTEEYFTKMNFFNLSKKNVFFFQQGTLPCMTKEGKIILESSFSVATAPDGNGGIYMGLHKSGAVKDMNERSVEGLFVYSVDNAVVRIADPTFIGYCLEQVADVGSKVVRKSGPHEKVGVLAKCNGKPTVVEYSEMTKEAAEKVNADGSLTFSAGNVCIHYYSRDFLETTCSPDNLTKVYHVAEKKIPYADPDSGKTIPASELKSNTGIKLESFIFDVFPESKKMAAFEVPRASEFAPVKNAPGSASDSPDTALQLISELHFSYLAKAGAEIKGESKLVEISPLVCYGFVSELAMFKGVQFHTPCELFLKGEKGGDGLEHVENLLDGKLVHYTKVDIKNEGKVIHLYEVSK